MATEERDSTADWIVPTDHLPPSAFDLQRQIDVATAVARAAEEAAMEIGQALLEAAEQARLAAVHAERSAEASVAAATSVASGRGSGGKGRLEPGPVAPAGRRPEPDEDADGDGTPDGHEAIPGSELPVAWSPVGGPAVAKRAPRQDAFAVDPRLLDFIRRADRVDHRLRLIFDGESRTGSGAGRVSDLRAEPTAP